jgi:hypothetical protein
VLGFSFWDIADLLVQAAPDVFVDLLLDLADATHQPEKAMVAWFITRSFLEPGRRLAPGDAGDDVRILEFQRRSAQLAYDWAIAQPEPPQSTINKAIEELQLRPHTDTRPEWATRCTIRSTLRRTRPGKAVWKGC